MGSTTPLDRRTDRAARLMSLTILTVACLALVSCGTARDGTVPFELYDSPVLAADAPSPTPTDRSTLGGHASSAGASNTAQPAAPPPKRRSDPPDEWNGDPNQKAVNADDDSEPTSDKSAGTDKTSADKSAADSTNDASDDSPRAPDGIANAARYVAAVYKVNGVEFTAEQRTSIPAMYRKCRSNHAVFNSGTPAAGDLAFFHNTLDTNGDGRNNDWYTHVALVESVDGDVVELLSYRDGEVRSFVMNPGQPDARQTRHGKPANSRIRPKQPDDPPFTQYLSGQLFAGYCSLLGDKRELIVIDNWRPGMEVQPPSDR